MKILITGGAGFIGSNLCEYFVENGYDVVCLDNLSTGFMSNIEKLQARTNFKFIYGDVRELDVCRNAVKGCDYVLHEAALGSVPRSINNPVATNQSNIDGFLNMLVAARDEGVKRFVYAASSSTYGDSKNLPKVEWKIGRPLSPYAVTKLVNELYADVFYKLYGLECIGLRYFNVFGRRQNPAGAYAAVIPLWVQALMRHESPHINGDGSYSRDFTYIDNVIQMNHLAISISSDELLQNLEKYNTSLPEDAPKDFVFNVAMGENTTLVELFESLRNELSAYDPMIKHIEPEFGDVRKGDIPHSMASIEKSKKVLGYSPKFTVYEGISNACEWYWNNIR